MLKEGDDELKSKLEELFDNDESLGIDSIIFDNGIIVNDFGDAVDYMVLE